MADFNYDEYDQAYEDSYADNPRLAEKARRWVNIAGAVCSVSLVLGLAFWGYRLAVRDVTGVPVMRAVAGAMRIAPSDPGGEQALNQGLTVNAIAATGTSAAPADQITLAPLAVALEDTDLPHASPSADAVPVLDASLTVSGQTGDAGALPLAGADPEALSATVDAATLIATADPNAIRHSLRPQPRPVAAGGKSVPIKVQTVSSQAIAAKEIDPASIAVGTRLAQLGAFETPDLARERFAELQANFGELMVGKDIVIQAATSGGRTFFRLRAHGFDNDEDARSFCSALLAEETDCIPVTQR